MSASVHTKSGQVSQRRRSGGLAVARGLTVAGIAVFALLSVMTFTDGLRSAHIVDAALRSVKSRNWVTI